MRHTKPGITLYHGTLRDLVPGILARGIDVGEGWGGAGTSGAFFSGSPEGALYWAKMTYQRTHGGDLDAERFDRKHGREIDNLLAIVVVRIPKGELHRLRADEEQFEDVQADFDPSDWRQSLKKIGDVRFDGPIPKEWILEVARPSELARQGTTLGARRLPDLQVFGRALRKFLSKNEVASILREGDWGAGGCWILAQTLVDYLGPPAELVAISEQRAGDFEDIVIPVSHVAVRYDDMYIDDRGAQPEGRFLSSLEFHGYENPEIHEWTEQMIREAVGLGIPCDPDAGKELLSLLVKEFGP